MITRKLVSRIKQSLKGYPAVALLGPRQSGKTTLAQSFNAHYFDLEQDSEKLRLNLLWDELTGKKKLLVLDEAQNYPEIFPRLRNAIDSDRKRMGRFLLLGSISPALIKETSEFLTGRISLIELTPSPFKS